MKVDKLKHLFKCEYCEEILASPIILPCGNKICQKDVSELTIDICTIRCVFCSEDHIVPKLGFPIDQHLQELLDLNISQFEFGPVYNHCKKNLKKLIEKIKEADTLRADPEYFIHQYFSDLRNQVDLRREDLKTKIDHCSDEILKNLQEYENECKLAYQKINEITGELDESKLLLNGLIEDFDSFDINDRKSKETTGKAMELKPLLTNQIIRLKQHFLNNREYKFKVTDVNMEKIFGTLVYNTETQTEFDSKIISGTDQYKALMKVCGFTNKLNWRLVYKACGDNFTADNFHKKCDILKNSLTIVKTVNNDIFGGYTEASWSGTGLKYDEHSFIFSLVNPSKTPLKFECTKPEEAINCSTFCGPCFGRTDLLMFHNSSSTRNHNFVGKNYQHPRLELVDSAVFLTGSMKFKIDEMEVFTRN